MQVKYSILNAEIFAACQWNVKEALYFYLVRFILFYLCVVDPCHYYLINKPEKLQNQASCLLKNSHDPYASISALNVVLCWEMLKITKKKRTDSNILIALFYNNTRIDTTVYPLETSYVSSRCDNVFYWVPPENGTTLPNRFCALTRIAFYFFAFSNR